MREGISPSADRSGERLRGGKRGLRVLYIIYGRSFYNNSFSLHYFCFRLAVLTVRLGARPLSIVQRRRVKFSVEQPRTLVGKAPARAVPRAVFTRRRCHVFRPFFFVDPNGLLCTVFLVGENNANVRRVSRVHRYNLQGDVINQFPCNTFLVVVGPTNDCRFFRYLAARVYRCKEQRRPIVYGKSFCLLHFREHVTRFNGLDPRVVHLQHPYRFLFAKGEGYRAVVVFVYRYREGTRIVVNRWCACKRLSFNQLAKGCTFGFLIGIAMGSNTQLSLQRFLQVRLITISAVSARTLRAPLLIGVTSAITIVR